MPRAARQAVLEPEAEAPETDDQKPLDSQANTVEGYRTGQVPEGELELARSVAKRMGWTPREEWKRDPAKWVDAPAFLEQTPRELEALKERNRRTAQAAADAIEDQRRQAVREAQAQIRAAAEASDPDRAEAAARQLAQVAGPPPQTVAWIGRNAWFNEDPDAQLLAVNEIERLARAGASIEDQLAAAETKVRKRFPEHFGQAEVRPEPEVQPEPRRAPPAVQGGTRTSEARTREKGFADIPPGDRALYQKHFARRFEESTGSKEAAEKKYAASYWRNKGDQ
jgi:hypothetical protein